jgi:hypothetical protein
VRTAGPDPAAERHTWRRSLQVGTAAALLVCVATATQYLVVGSVWGNWVYGYVQPVTVRALGVFVIVTVVAVLALRYSIAAVRRHQWLVVIAWLLIAFGSQLLLRSATPFSLRRIFISNGANAFYGVTLNYPASTVISDFNRVRGEWPTHARSNMPGKLMTIYALELVTRRPRVLAWLVMFLSNLGGVLLYVFVRDLFADRQVALFSLVLYFFVPGKLYFFPLMNTVTPTLLVACACLVLKWLMTGRTAYAALSGVAFFGLLFFEPLPLVMGALLPVLAAWSVRRGTMSLPALAVQSAALVLAFAAVHVAVYWFSGFNAIDTFRQLGAEAVAFNADAQRRYVIWVWQNLFDFLYSVGVCQAIVFLAILAHALRARMMNPIAVLCMSLAAVLLIIDVIGVNRGEVVRLWIFLACLFQIPAAYVCAQLNSRLAIALVISTTVLQDALGTSMIGFLVP